MSCILKLIFKHVKKYDFNICDKKRIEHFQFSEVHCCE